MEAAAFYAATLGAEFDGLFFGLRNMDVAEEMRREASLRNDLRRIGVKEDEVMRSVRRESFGAMAGCNSYSILQVTGPAAEKWALTAGEKFFSLLERVHLKIWLEPAFEGATEAFMDAVQSSVGTVQVQKTVSGNRARSNALKGRHSLAIGSKRAERQIFTYRRARENTGMEFKMRGEPVRKLVEEVLKTVAERKEIAGLPSNFLNPYSTLSSRLGLEFAYYQEKHLHRNGIELEDFFAATTSRSGVIAFSLNSPSQEVQEQDAPPFDSPSDEEERKLMESIINLFDLWEDEIEPAPADTAWQIPIDLEGLE